MNNVTLDTNNKSQRKIELFREFCSLPASRIAELPLSMFEPLNKWFGIAFNWLFDNLVTQWMSDLKDNHPKVFWISSAVWIPIAVVIYFYAIDLWLIGVFTSVAIIISATVILTLICKICHLLFLIISKRK